MTRRAAAGAAAALLLALVLASQSWGELPRRIRSLRIFAPKELAVRRLGGSGAAFDRQFFSFLENARRRLPATTPGVVIRGALVDDAHLFLATYCLAPLDVVRAEELSQFGPPHGWVIAEYGAHPMSGVGVLAQFPEGALLGPVP